MKVRLAICAVCGGEFDEGEWDADTRCPECESPKQRKGTRTASLASLSQTPATPMDELQRLGQEYDGEEVEPRYLIRKNGYFYRPNAEGYTFCAHDAGRFTLEEAIQYSHPNGPDGPRDGITYELAPPATPSPMVQEGLREALDVGEKFLNACFSAWSCGEPHHRVKTMMDRADEFRAALDALSATPAPPVKETDRPSALDKRTFLTCVSGDGPTPYLKVHFNNLADAHAAHDELLGVKKEVD